MLRPLAVLFFLLVQILCVRAEQPKFEDRVGDTYEIRLESVSKTSGGGTTGNSHSASMLVERVIALHDDSIELEFDLPGQTSPQDRARTWQFPARVLESSERPLQLLNRPELETRLRAWLQRGRMTESACGRWVFTWTAFKIECDPESVLQTLEPFDLRVGDLRHRAPHKEPRARGTAFLRMGSRHSGGATYAAEMEIDPDQVRQERAKEDVAVAEMSGKMPLALEAALQARETERISGTIATTIETDAAKRVTRRRRVTSIEISDEAGSLERQTTTMTVERRLILRGERDH
jgi:hypothetical protein